jgi:hypothetical protein
MRGNVELRNPLTLPESIQGSNFSRPSPGDELTRSQLENLIARADREPDQARRWWLYDQPIRHLARTLRKFAGYCHWPLTFAGVCASLLVLWIYSLQPKGVYIYSVDDHDDPVSWRVLEQKNDFDFVLQKVERGIPQPPSVAYFRGYRPRFEAGMTLTWFSFIDRGQWWDITPGEYGYRILRDQNLCPIVPANCRHINCADKEHDHVICEGAPKFE